MRRIPRPNKVSVDKHSALNKTERRSVRKVVHEVRQVGRKITEKP